MALVMIPGVKIAMGGREWAIPPLTLGQLKVLLPKVRELTTVGAAMDEKQISVVAEVVAAAMQRNYPDVKPEDVENLLDLGNAQAVLQAVMMGSGLKSSGEGVAVVTTGDQSTAFSPPPADTAIQ